MHQKIDLSYTITAQLEKEINGIAGTITATPSGITGSGSMQLQLVIKKVYNHKFMIKPSFKKRAFVCIIFVVLNNFC